MVPLNRAELEPVATSLATCQPLRTIAQLAGLLTVPSLQANAIRLEVLVHLAVAHCRGERQPARAEIEAWLNEHLDGAEISSLEDPAEDAFITNVQTPKGNRRIFEGLWESADYVVQTVLDTLNGESAPRECRELLAPVYGLLRLSDDVAERLALPRWHIEPSTPQDVVELPPELNVEARAAIVTFGPDRLASLGLTAADLAVFTLREFDRHSLSLETIGESTLETRPLLDTGQALVLALPTAVSQAIKQYLVNELNKAGYLRSFGTALAKMQARQVEREGLWEFRGEAESLRPPSPEQPIPPLHAYLLRYDHDKYLHLVVLHGRMEMVGDVVTEVGNTPDETRGLEDYVRVVAEHCRTGGKCTHGTTLVIVGGLTPRHNIRIRVHLDNWQASVVGIADFLMLAQEPERPVTRYLKCVRQKQFAESRGVEFVNMNGDYNLYCYWREAHYELIPREMRLGTRSMVFVANNMVLSPRLITRRLSDSHLAEAGDGFERVIRLNKDAHFKSLRDRPVYASLEQLRRGVLAGLVETLRGPSWLFVVERSEDAKSHRLLYEMWTGFIGLYDRAVSEVERLRPGVATGPIAVHLDATDLVISDGALTPTAGTEFGQPVVRVDMGQRTARVQMPADFLGHFQQPEAKGERLLLHAIVQALLWLHDGAVDNDDTSVAASIVERVLANPGIRVLHVFQTYYPIEYLLAGRATTARFISAEDVAFGRLALSDGCVTQELGSVIETKEDCNAALHRMVDKLWNQIRDRLRTLDRASVISQVLDVHEGILNDREHWRRTTNALVALYSSADDVVAVAQERESERTNAAVAARAVLEMAICECAEAGGRLLTTEALDELLARVALLIEVATDSDAVNSEFTTPRLELHRNGTYSLDRKESDSIIAPFAQAAFREEFEEAASSYSALYRVRRPDGRARTDEQFPQEYRAAFHAEYGLTPGEAVEAFVGLMDLAVEKNSVVVEATRGDIKARLASVRGLSLDVCEAFLRAFSILHRSDWSTPPVGFTNRDLNPWRFRRKLSIMARPMLASGERDDDSVWFGAGTLRLGFGLLLDRINRGQVPQEFFRSSAMRSHIGGVNAEKGLAFARSVAGQFRERGWQARTEVQMTELGGSAEMGDVDVLAWNVSGEVYVVECKRLQLARTVAEVSEICRRFRGEAKDELAKHVRRVNWVKKNSVGLQRIVGFVPDATRIDHRLITNTHVPMMYLRSLPIDSEKIGPLWWQGHQPGVLVGEQ